MKVATIIYDSVVDGEGVRNTIFFQGCTINCPKCHNPESHNRRKGHNWSPEQIIKQMKTNSFNNKITLSGGEPLEQHLDQLKKFIILFKEECKKINKRPNIWIYSGKHYLDANFCNEKYKEILQECDVLVDGPFVYQKKTKKAIYRGSSNQRIIDLNKSFKEKTIILHKLN